MTRSESRGSKGAALCECGCGTQITSQHANARYARYACKSRAWRAKTGYRLQATRKPCQTPKKPNASGRQLSYRRAVTQLTNWIQLNWPTATNPQAIAEHVLTPALPDRQQDHERSLP